MGLIEGKTQAVNHSLLDVFLDHVFEVPLSRVSFAYNGQIYDLSGHLKYIIQVKTEVTLIEVCVHILNIRLVAPRNHHLIF